MSTTDHPGLSACPACVVGAPQIDRGRLQADACSIDLAVPAIHCAACIATIEKGFKSRPEITDARVNLSRKQVRITAPAELDPEACIAVLERLGYAALPLDSDLLGPAQDKQARDLLMRLAVAGFAMMNVMLLSVAVWSGASDATKVLFHWLSALITIPAVAFSAQPFFRHAWQALRVGRLNMDVPISLAILLTCASSLYETYAHGAHAYFDAAIALTFFLLIGRYLDHRSRAAAKSAAAELAAMDTPRVTRETDGVRETVAASALELGDHVVILPGGRIPVDGVIVEGQSDLDRALLTGESLPVVARPGQSVSAGEMNLTGPITVAATAVGEDTTLKRMVAMIDASETARNKFTAIADRAAAIYAPAVHLLALLGFAIWMVYSGGDVRQSMNIAIAVLIITCPCALGLAVPAVSTAAAARLFDRGMLVKDATALERLAQIDTVVFDKTGTLTDGTLHVSGLDTIPMADLQVAAALAQASNHPVARAIAMGLQDAQIVTASVTGITEHPGAGLEGYLGDVPVRLGSSAWVGAAEGDGDGTWVRVGQGAPHPLPLASHLRDGAVEMIQELRARGFDLHMISGDTDTATDLVARALGLPQTRARCQPEDKVSYLKALAQDGHKVLMVGDGLNDTGALAAAFASLSPATAADASRAASDVVLLHHSLSGVPDLLRTATLSHRCVTQNFVVAAVYNVIALPIAFLGLCSPLIAAIAMSTSSVAVLANALVVRFRK